MLKSSFYPRSNLCDHSLNFPVSCVQVLAEYVGGGDLGLHLLSGGLPLAQLREYTHQLVEALCYLHGKAVVHKDLRVSALRYDLKKSRRVAVVTRSHMNGLLPFKRTTILVPIAPFASLSRLGPWPWRDEGLWGHWIFELIRIFLILSRSKNALTVPHSL